MKTLMLSTAFCATASLAMAAAHAMAPGVEASDQAVENGMVTAAKVIAPETGWLVVHRTDAEMAPGPVVGHAALEEGENMEVSAELTEEVAAGDMLMLMVHSEAGGTEEGVFEYTLGATEDGPIRVDGELVMTTITVQ
ncbi:MULTISPECIES: DUF7282 domain-containing protein [unclassified Roseivivax]|uniref:DUF7282 domain-containing protein n=1 Tax=Roseivivax sp. GX 12232 TaxID=2900547 RepID=UPI001E35CE5A|nr:hypothetical protein [Roseivivax sp. GX 12232]MCE0506326.1 hypothetical protein [Roseivivax sp. GX 12232]